MNELLLQKQLNYATGMCDFAAEHGKTEVMFNISYSTLQPILKKLARNGLLLGELIPSQNKSRRGAPRVFYTVTELGKKALYNAYIYRKQIWDDYDNLGFESA